MKLVIYLSGRSATGAPWCAAARAESPSHTKVALDHVRELGKGAPVAELHVDLPEHFLTPPAPLGIGLTGDVVEAVDPTSAPAPMELASDDDGMPF